MRLRAAETKQCPCSLRRAHQSARRSSGRMCSRDGAGGAAAAYREPPPAPCTHQCVQVRLRLLPPPPLLLLLLRRQPRAHVRRNVLLRHLSQAQTTGDAAMRVCKQADGQRLGAAPAPAARPNGASDPPLDRAACQQPQRLTAGPAAAHLAHDCVPLALPHVNQHVGVGGARQAQAAKAACAPVGGSRGGWGRRAPLRCSPGRAWQCQPSCLPSRAPAGHPGAHRRAARRPRRPSCRPARPCCLPAPPVRRRTSATACRQACVAGGGEGWAGRGGLETMAAGWHEGACAARIWARLAHRSPAPWPNPRPSRAHPGAHRTKA